MSVEGVSSGEIQTDQKLVYKLNIKENIAPAIWRQTQQAFEAADSLNADLMLIHMNTYGGTVLDADSIRTKILNSPIPVYVFIDNNAASAGALISVACDRIYMRKGSSIGAATVVNQTGEKMPDKYQSYMRSIMRATAESHGKDTIIEQQDTILRWKRDPRIAEAMVDEDVYIEGIIDTGKILTFTPLEAVKYGFCEGIVENVEELMDEAGYENYEIVEYKPTGLERLIGFLVNPVVSGILIMAILGGIYFEMQTPGIGFPLIIAVLAAITYFAPLYLEGLAANWEIIIFVVGLILVAVEIFVFPGFGIAGISGIVLAFSGLVLSLIGNVHFNFDGVEPRQVMVALSTVVIATFTGFVLSLWLSKRLFTTQSGVLKNLSLQDVQKREDGYVSIDIRLMDLKGKEGIAHTVLRPSGKVKIEETVYDAVSELGMIEKGEAIKVVRVETTQVYVEKI
ncbi:MAG: serine protease [Bacteroidetes bacterium GWF2_42_66]|nr:MAG: serine protease [Bacteroidetes bacterium GWA2_42_15]OFY02631.1 MAG: serine protease [Bacteroidetes bacterium GWE2_42_39]OFY41478.1 MAG: serine protease [Bacteroidetes bacterium GWF2_42_66]